MMQVADMMQANGRVFLKSEYGQIGDGWPCLSFSRQFVGDRLRRDFVPGRDVIIYVGTTDAKTTPNPDHRSCLLSVIVVEPKQILDTRKIVPADVWQRTVATYRERWLLSMPVVNATQCKGPPYPRAHEVVPDAYRLFSDPTTRGNVVEVLATERNAVMRLEIDPVQLNLAPDVAAYIALRPNPNIDRAIKEHAFRIAELIRSRVDASGKQVVRVNPSRIAPDLNLINLIEKKWVLEQNGLCPLCGGLLIANTSNPMLQPSADRIVSTNPAYDDDNMQITHLA